MANAVHVILLISGTLGLILSTGMMILIFGYKRRSRSYHNAFNANVSVAEAGFSLVMLVMALLRVSGIVGTVGTNGVDVSSRFGMSDIAVSASVSQSESMKWMASAQYLTETDWICQIEGFLLNVFLIVFSCNNAFISVYVYNHCRPCAWVVPRHYIYSIIALIWILAIVIGTMPWWWWAWIAWSSPSSSSSSWESVIIYSTYHPVASNSFCFLRFTVTKPTFMIAANIIHLFLVCVSPCVSFSVYSFMSVKFQILLREGNGLYGNEFLDGVSSDDDDNDDDHRIDAADRVDQDTDKPQNNDPSTQMDGLGMAVKSDVVVNLHDKQDRDSDVEPCDSNFGITSGYTMTEELVRNTGNQPGGIDAVSYDVMAVGVQTNDVVVSAVGGEDNGCDTTATTVKLDLLNKDTETAQPNIDTPCVVHLSEDEHDVEGIGYDRKESDLDSIDATQSTIWQKKHDTNRVETQKRLKKALEDQRHAQLVKKAQEKSRKGSLALAVRRATIGDEGVEEAAMAAVTAAAAIRAAIEARHRHVTRSRIQRILHTRAAYVIVIWIICCSVFVINNILDMTLYRDDDVSTTTSSSSPSRAVDVTWNAVGCILLTLYPSLDNIMHLINDGNAMKSMSITFFTTRQSVSDVVCVLYAWCRRWRLYRSVIPPSTV